MCGTFKIVLNMFFINIKIFEIEKKSYDYNNELIR